MNMANITNDNVAVTKMIKKCAWCHEDIGVQEFRSEDPKYCYYTGNYIAEEDGKFYCSKECYSLSHRAKISELIKSLEEAKKKYGDVEVRVQYRDDTIFYEGMDMVVENYFDEEDNVYVL